MSRKSREGVKLTEESYYGTRQRAIRIKCLDCSGGDRKSVIDCPMKNCPLWLFRLSKPVSLEDCNEQREYIKEKGENLWLKN